MRVVEYVCRVCRTTVELTHEELERCPHCEGRDLEIHYFEDFSLRSLLWRLAELEYAVDELTRRLDDAVVE